MKTTHKWLTLALVPLLLIGAMTAVLSADDAAAAPRLFDTPEAAMEAMATALRTNDDAAMKAIVGPDSDDLIQSGKDPIVARERARVATLIAERVAWDELDDGTKVPVVGIEAWPMPVPLAPKDGKWSFDAVQGRDEVLARRIGTAELRTMSLMRAIHDAQEAYKAQDRDGDGVLEYAQRFVSTEGTHDGLFWPDADDGSVEDRSPLGALVDELTPYLDGKSKGVPFGGYLFKILTGQGPNAVGGAQAYVSGGNMTGGFMIVAVPAEYRLTGVMSFAISHRGRLVESDLGAKSLQKFKDVTVFDPATPWTISDVSK